MKRDVLSSRSNVAYSHWCSVGIMLLIYMLFPLGFDVFKLMESINQERFGPVDVRAVETVTEDGYKTFCSCKDDKERAGWETV